MADDTIDITDLVSGIKSVWIRCAVTGVLAATKTTPYLAWLSWPVISSLFEYFLNKLITSIADGVEMEAFFLNTAIRKASQATDFVNAIKIKNNLPPTASDAEYEAAEIAEMNAFKNFVLVTN